MAASTSFINTVLDSGIAGVQTAYTGIYVGLYSGGTEANGGNYNQQLIPAFNAASSATKAATNRVNFAPTGANWSYDQLRLYSVNTGVLLHSVTVSPSQIINAGDIHSILVTFSGS